MTLSYTVTGTLKKQKKYQTTHWAIITQSEEQEDHDPIPYVDIQDMTP